MELGDACICTCTDEEYYVCHRSHGYSTSLSPPLLFPLFSPQRIWRIEIHATLDRLRCSRRTGTDCCFGAHAPDLENRTSLFALFPCLLKGRFSLPTQRAGLFNTVCSAIIRLCSVLRFPFGSSKVDWQRKVGKRHNYSFDGLTADFSSPGGVGEGGRGENEPILIPLSLSLSLSFSPFHSKSHLSSHV